MIYGNIVGCTGMAQTYILQDENGNEFPAVLVDTEIVFDATENDIRKGKIAATEKGVTIGTKEIPAYHTTEGICYIEPGNKLIINMFSNLCQYTKLQALICTYNTSLNDSVATEKVLIDNKVYPVNSVIPISDVVIDPDNNAIDLSITNESEKPIVIRYFTYKEEP